LDFLFFEIGNRISQKETITSVTNYYLGALAFLPLFRVPMVILPFLFALCDFALAFWKRSSSLPLFCRTGLRSKSTQIKSKLMRKMSVWNLKSWGEIFENCTDGTIQIGKRFWHNLFLLLESNSILTIFGKHITWFQKWTLLSMLPRMKWTFKGTYFQRCTVHICLNKLESIISYKNSDKRFNQ
jgi:hypothetical protein